MSSGGPHTSLLFCVACLLVWFTYFAVVRQPSAGHAITVIREAQESIAMLDESSIPPGTLRDIQDKLSQAHRALSEKRYQEAIEIGMHADALARQAR